MSEFNIGEKIVYPGQGVCIVDDIQTLKISNESQQFLFLSVLETNPLKKIKVPLTQVKKVGLRRIIDQKTANKVYEVLRDRDVVIDNQTWNRRLREYTQKIKTGSVFEIAKVIRDLSVIKSDKELSSSEKQMFDTAQGLLVKEISIAKSSPEDAVKAELDVLCHNI
ncbi:MAG: CarD family transcriptional regulator [Deltaproteobacteria bacterium]|nr:CarD family transcriptional regulator [Deltaproteobacteria bacterium]